MCYILLESAPNDSKNNFIQWLDDIVSRLAGPGAIVRKSDGTKYPCFYQAAQVPVD